MMAQVVASEGFMLVRTVERGEYRGVDRAPFEPTILERELDPSVRTPETIDGIWKLYPDGWRRAAYRLFSENRVRGPRCELPLVASVDVAARIRDLIPKSEGEYEVIECRVTENPPFLGRQLEDGGFLGYDVVYPGGDYYSAIKNGLHVNPHPELRQEFAHALNSFGLFDRAAPIGSFVLRFQAVVPSEASSEFVVVELWDPVY